MLFQNTRSLDTHDSDKEILDSKLWAFQVGFHHSLQPFQAFSVLTARETLAAVTVFSFPKYTSCAFGGVIVTGFKISFKHYLHLPKMSCSLLSKTLFKSLMDLAVWDLFAANTPYGFPEHFVYMPVIQIQFMWKFFEDCFSDVLSPCVVRSIAHLRTANAKKSRLCCVAMLCRLLSLHE